MDDELKHYLEAMRAESRERGEQTASRLDKLDSRLDNMERTDTVIQGEVRLLGTRVGTLESRVQRIDSDHQATKRGSIQGDEAQQAALVSAMDIHAKALAAVAKKVDDIADRPDTADKVIEAMKEAAKKPAIQRLGSAAVGVLLLILTLLGLKLQQQISHLEEKPAIPAGSAK
jgi:type II secretory pathway component HofQ